MLDPEHLTHERFSQNLNTSFQVVADDGQRFSIKLTEVSDLKKTQHTERFSLLFESPTHYFLPQGMFTVQHEQMGTFELFLVPVFKEEQCFVYEALFNRLVNRQ